MELSEVMRTTFAARDFLLKRSQMNRSVGYWITLGSPLVEGIIKAGKSSLSERRKREKHLCL